MRLSDLAVNEKILRPTGGCHSCSRGKRNFIGMEKRDSSIIIVGDSPTPNDITNGRPFSGNSGVGLRSLLAENGITEYSTTYVVHCGVPEDDHSDKKAVACCLNQFTLDEVKGYPLVVLAGSQATSAFFPKAKSWKFQGNVAWHPDFPGQRFYSISSPMYVQQHPDEVEWYRKQIERLGRIAKGEASTFSVVQGDSQDFMEKLRAYMQKRRLGIDLETNQLRPWEGGGHIKSLALAHSKEEALFAHKDEPHFVYVLQALVEWLQQPQNQPVGHNLGFDITRWLESLLDFHMKCNVVLDTMSLYYEAKQYQEPSLKELVAKELDGYRYLIHEPHLEKNLWLLGQYNAEDVIHPLELVDRGLRLLRPSTRDLYLRVSGPAGLAVERLTTTGVYFRQDNLIETRESLLKQRAEAIEEWKAADPLFIPSRHEGGNGELEYLFTLKGLPVISKTKKDKPSTDEEAVKTWIQQGHTELVPMLKVRKIDKSMSTYVEPYEGHLAIDGRVHPSYFTTSTDSGRTSARDPNYQNQQRGPTIRRNFGAQPGWTFLEADFSQIEMRIMMSLARDPVGIKAYRDGEDLHTRTAIAMAGANYTKEHRSRAKPLNFSLVYKGTWRTVQSYARTAYEIFFTDQEAKDYTDMWLGTYPQIPKFHEFCDQQLIANRGWAENAVGRVWHYSNWDHPDQKKRDHAFRAHVNSKGQGPNAYMLLYTMILAMREADRRNIPVLWVGEVHDSIHAEVRDDAIEDVIRIIDAAAAKVAAWTASWFLVPLRMDYAWGPTWAETKELKDKDRIAMGLAA